MKSRPQPARMRIRLSTIAWVIQQASEWSTMTPSTVAGAGCAPATYHRRCADHLSTGLKMSLLRAVQRAFSKIAPPSLAEAWVSHRSKTQCLLALCDQIYPHLFALQDNTGLLVESPIVRKSATNVLLTIDLTPAVAAEALADDSNVGVIVAYHPIIFKGLKSLTCSDPLQQVILKCAAAGIR